MATNYTYLDSEGLSHLVEKLKTYISNTDLATLQSANGYTDEKIAIVNSAITKAQAAAETAQTSADEAQSDIDALILKIGTVPDGQTIMSIIDTIKKSAYDDTEVRGLIQDNADEITALKSKDTELASSIKTNTDAINVLNGTGTGSVDKKISDAFNKFATDVTNDDVVNSYKELVDWVVTHGSEATEMANAISTNEKSISDLKALVGTIPSTASATTIVTLIQELVSVEQTRAEGVESGLETRINTLEQKTSNTGSIAEDIQTAKEEAITEAVAQATADATTKANMAESNANDYTDDKIAEVQADVDKNTSDLVTLTAQVNNNKNDISSLKTSVNTTLPNSIAEAKSAANAAQSDVNTLKASVASNTSNITTVSDRVSTLEGTAHTHSAITTSYIDGLF